MELDASYTIAQIHQRSGGILLYDSIRLLRYLYRPHTLGNIEPPVSCACQIEVAAAGGGMLVVGIPGMLAAGEQLLHVSCNRVALFLHALDRGSNASGVPHLERSQLPVEAGAHSAIDFDYRVGDFRYAICRISPKLGQRCPVELSGFVARIGIENHLQPLGR